MIHTSKRFWLTEEQLRDVMYSVIGISPYESQDPDDMKEYPIPDGEEILVFVQNNQACPVPSGQEQVLDELVSVLASRLIIGTSLTTVQYKEVMHEIRFAAEELRKQGEQR